MVDGDSRQATALADAPSTGRATGTRGPYKKSARTRAAILAAATEVFVEQGSRAGSMREIARRCGIDQSTVLHHFPNKPALLLALMHDRDTRADEIIGMDPGEDVDGVPAALLRLARQNTQQPHIIALYSVLAAESVTEDHPLEEFFAERTVRVRRAFEDWFTGAAEAGMVREGVTPAFAATAFFALWEGVQLHWLIDRDGVDVVAVLEDFLRLILRQDAI
ncbi:TetR/AcrR family transcriptional regulator [Demequina sp. SYSU T00192]|uniref:TetR/AcrR family transcriptional regulator n=1 Tax=Demequina litoralis TaxID=3051660 RepID=A0ABT8G5P7_9MICO|nr:TetR/AcrR family transcriptional regulator [Demequina sp. SYSU T00192]MDN4474451.1 TetR/AcrR family transcriptional regulator [Demequina sp. SYSU T00192]